MNTELKRTGRLSAWAVAGMASLIVAAPVGAQPFSVTQPGVITINDNSSATPYPSSIVVSNVVGTIEKVTVSLNGITHGYPDDIDVLLVGPDTNAVVVMSDAGLGFDLNSVTLTFDDAASASLPDDTQITAGTYKPSNYEGSSTDPFVAPAPAGPYNATLSVFTNGNPNGTWRLFVVDDNLVDAGSISSGWTLNLWTTPTVSVTNAVATLEDTPVTVNVTVGDSDDPPNNLIVSGTSSDQTIVTNTAIVAGGSGTARTLTITPRTNQFGTVTITVLVKDGLATVSSNLTLTINPVNDNPPISLNTNKVSTVAGVLTTNLIAVLRDVDDNVDTLQLSASSSNTNVVANTNVFFVRGVNGTNTFTIAPVGAATGTATLTIQVSDGHGSNATSTATIDVTVNPVPHAIFGNSNPITINDNAVASPYPSQLTVSNVSGLIGKLTVVLADV